MASYCLDTSAVVKRYINEPGSSWVKALADPTARHSFYLARITDVEVTSALARRRGQPGLALPHAATALRWFRDHLALQYRIVEVTTSILQHASTLANRHALRGYDAVQLAVALEVVGSFPGSVLVSADAELNAAAVLEGLIVLDPNDHP